MKPRDLILPLLLLLCVLPTSADATRVHVNEGSDPRAIEIAQATVEAMGGWQALDATRFVSWNFFARRQHYWDRHSGDIRIESERDGVLTVILMNVHTKQGRVFKDGAALEGEELAELLDAGHQIWVNDSYWMFMPYKLLDPGVTLGYAGERPTAAGNDADVLELTFVEVGYTPDNRYHVYVGKESGLVEQWDFYAEADNEEPGFASPWADWKTFGEIKLATNHGRGVDWAIAVHDTLPATVFDDPLRSNVRSNGAMAAHRVVIVGGGFGGLATAIGLRREAVEVTLVDRRNFHLFQPLLYQVATGGLSPADIASPLRTVVKRQPHTHVLHAPVRAIDADRRVVRYEGGELPYDTLVLATGVTPTYFGNEGFERHAPALKTVEDATRIRAKILDAFERAEREPDDEARRARLTFVVVGGGPTGVELAGAVGELARHALKGDFRRIRPDEARVIVVEGGNRLLPAFPERLSACARRSLERLGVEVLCDTFVDAIDETSATLRPRDGERGRSLATHTVLWAAGMTASPLGKALAAATGAAVDRIGRVVVEPDCSLPGRPEIFVIGDLARFDDASGEPLPGVAPVAMQQGSHVACTIAARLAGRAVAQFRYRDKGSLAVIGRAAAVADLGKRMRFSGYPAWLLWLFVHIMYLVEYENRVLVLIQWAFSYVTRKRGARLITGQDEI